MIQGSINIAMLHEYNIPINIIRNIESSKVYDFLLVNNEFRIAETDYLDGLVIPEQCIRFKDDVRKVGRPKQHECKIFVGIRINPILLRKIEKLAEIRNITRTNAIEMLLENAFESL